MTFEFSSRRAPSSAILLLLSLLAGGFSGCGGGSSVSPPVMMTPPNLINQTPHTIGVRPTGSGFAEFYDRMTGNTFTPRGNNYIRLAWQQPPFQGWPQEYYHSTFNVQGLYDSARAETALAAMQTSGYNVVRVFLNGCCTGSIGSPSGGLSTGYIANLVDFLKRAANHNVYVLMTWDWLPAEGGYDPGPCPQFKDINVINLCAGGVAATTRFFHDLVEALIAQGAPFETIFAYELRNEFYYASNAAPLDAAIGMVTAADGKTYDMSSGVSRQQMMDNGLTYFTDQVRAAIIAVDPTALVDVGFFWPQTPNSTRIGDPRVIEVYPAMANSTADFVDIHGGPGSYPPPMAQLFQNYGFVGYQQQKPVLMGEFEGVMSDYPVITDAAAAVKNWQIQSCKYSIKGWLLWTWDLGPVESRDPNPDWNALSGNGEINMALAPAVRPDPCQ